MPTTLAPRLHPRKTPSQARSGVTVTAILDATIQVLIRDGLTRLTTTRVATRAGVSVGTLYQYFADKRSLVAAVKQRHLGEIVDAVEQACATHRGAPVRLMVTSLCQAFIDAKIRRVDESRALYSAGSEVDGDVLVRAASLRAQQAIAAMLATAPDATFEDPAMAAMMLSTAPVGPVQALLESGAPTSMVALLRTHLTELCVGYVERVGVSGPVAVAAAPEPASRPASASHRRARASARST